MKWLRIVFSDSIIYYCRCSPVMAFHIADSLQVPLLYISTDYVFDGKSPPYAVDAVPNPLNLYGKTKLEGEKVTLEVGKGNILMNDHKYLSKCNIGMEFVTRMTPIEKAKCVEKSFLHSNETVVKHKWVVLYL